MDEWRWVNVNDTAPVQQMHPRRLNSNNTHESGAECESMQRYHNAVHQQQKQAIHGLDQE